MAADPLSDPSPSALVGAAEAGSEAVVPGFERFASAQELKDYLLQAALAQWQQLFGQRGGGGLVVCYDVALGLPATVARAAADSFSGTNVQVAGVDEADLVKTDGDYLYLLRGKDLLILDTRSAAEMQLVSHTRLNIDATDMYLHGDQLTVIAESCQNGTSGTDVTVYDVSDRAQPVVHRQTLLEGRYISSRQVDDRLVFVLENGFLLPRPEFIPDPDPPTPPADLTGGDADASLQFSLTSHWHWQPGRYETQEEYLARVEDQILELALPGYRTFDEEAVESHGLLSAATEVYRPLSTAPHSLISVVVLDARGEAEAPLSTASVPVAVSSSQVYATAENIYVLGNRWDGPGQSTTIHKFHLSATGVDLVATGSVEGAILNQFSIDEHEGFLRIATTEGWGNGARNNVYVLGQEGSELNVVGSIEDIAPGERIFAVRFMGDRGFVVTFRQIDPLFAIDFSDPTQPRLAGELHIPGFSNYLHPVGENHLIGIGRDGGLQVSLFDVSNLAEPRLVERFSIDAGFWAGSEATFDHRAVGYFSQTQTLAIPVQPSPMWIGGTWQVAAPPSEMWVFHVDVSEGLSLEARIDMEGTARRSLQIDEALYLVSTETVMANSLADPNVQLAAVDLPEGESYNVVERPIMPWPRPRPMPLPVVILPPDPEPLPLPEPDPEVTPPPPVSEVVPEPVVESEVPEMDVVDSEPTKDPPTIELETDVVEVPDLVTVTFADAANVDALDGQISSELASYLAAGVDSLNVVPEAIDISGRSSEIVAAPSSKRVLHVPAADSRGELLSALPNDATRRKQVRLPTRVPGHIDPLILVDALFASDSWNDQLV